MPDERILWIERLVPRDLRERVFRESLRETERAYRARHRRSRSRLSRAGVTGWRMAQIVGLVIECRRLARSTRRETSQSSRAAILPLLLQDLRFGARTLLKAPGVSIVSVLTLALGIGGTASTFSVVRYVLLRPLPYPGADRVVDLNEWTAGRATTVSPPNFVDWWAGNTTFEAMAAYQQQNLTLSVGSEPERIDAAAVAPELFRVLGMPPLFGRVFAPNEDQPGASKVVVISHALWQRRFGSDPGLVGRLITLEGESYGVVGIMPPRFDFPDGIELWVPLSFGARDLSPNQRGAHYVRAVGRLKGDVTPAQAQTDLDAIEHRLAAQYPDKLTGYSVRVQPLLDSLVGPVRRPLLVLMGAVGFVLLIACVNVSNLLLARATTRTGEIAVRSALGAGRRRIVSQLLSESVVLAAAGGAAGLLLAVWAVHVLTVMAPQDLPRGTDFSLDPWVLTFALIVSLVTGILFGLVPAVVSSRADIVGFLKEMRRGPSGSGRGRALRNALVTIEVALSLILLAGAGLAMRSFERLTRVNPGFDPSHVLTFDVRLPEARYRSVPAIERFFREFDTRLAQVGVRAAGGIFLPPVSPGGFGGTFTIADKHDGENEGNAQVRPITPGYFAALRIPLRAGRVFTPLDRSGAPGVAVVSETTAHQYWPGENAIGKRVRIHVSMGVAEEIREVVGIVGDVRTRALDAAFAPVIYVPETQYVSDELTFLVRTEGDPHQALPMVRAQLAALDSQVALSRVRTMEDVVAASTAQSQFRTRILAIFAGIALVLAAVGLYGVVAFSVTQRSGELGLRVALGAHRQDVLRLVLRQGLWPVGLGLACGLIGAAALTQVMGTLLYEIDPFDPITLATVSVALLTVAIGACYIPARRAMAVDPVTVLR
jgi:putative ABC transport system permease protein